MIIDKKEVIAGSFNFTKAAQNKNGENVLIVNNVNLASTYLDNWSYRQIQSREVESLNAGFG